MKLFLFLLFVILSSSIYAKKLIFVRVYDISGKKIDKGHVSSVTDTTLLLEGKNTTRSISIKSIGFIKTKHSAGNNILMGSIITSSILGIAGLVIDPGPSNGIALSFSRSDAAAGGLLVGIPFGDVFGCIATLFKNSKKYLVNGDAVKWKKFQATITNPEIK